MFTDQLNYILVNYFVKSKTSKNNINRFLFNVLIVLFIKKLSY